MKKSALLLLALLGAIAFVSCSDDDSENTPSGLIYSYFPVNEDHEVIYDVVHITKDGFNGAQDTAIYQLKEVIESHFTDNEGRTTQRLERYTRNDPADSWVIKDVWTTNLTPSRVEKKEENYVYVKLVFPINNIVEWNGNVLNDLDPQEYEYLDLHEPDVIGGIPFDSTLSVLEADDNFRTVTKYELETYAPGVGLIFREKNIVNWYRGAHPSQDSIVSQDLYKATVVSWAN
jgi:hypothetical protein